MNARFSLLVIGDTQYLFDGDRTAPELLAATLRHVAALVAAEAIAPIRHVIHVGDVTEHGWSGECDLSVQALTEAQRGLGGQAWTVATGNHDVAHSSGDDRGPTDFLRAFGPGCGLLAGAHLHGVVVHSDDGYSSWREVALPDGGTLGVLALDWRPTAPTWAWASEVLAGHSEVPTIVVTHDAAFDHRLTPQGRRLRDALASYPQVFLVLAGHNWPSTRVREPGREYHAVNHQQLPFGGAGTVRIYEFDPSTGEAQAITLNAALSDPRILRSVAARRQLAVAGRDDQFRFALPAAWGGGRDLPWQAQGMRLVADISPDGECEFEAELSGTAVIEVRCTLPPAMPRHWEVLLARLGSAEGSPEPLASLSLSSENFLGWQAVVAESESWSTSHEYPPGASLTVVIRQGEDPGVWIDGDRVGRSDAFLGQPLADGPWRWRVGAGEYEGRRTDPFLGAVSRVRLWC